MNKLEKAEKEIAAFEQKLGVNFNDKKLLVQAFTHRSYINENRDFPINHNERLEFLGDAVLELAVTRFLFDTYPDKPEGELTSYRAALVNTASLSFTARELGMNDMLLLSRGESKDTGRARNYILANTLEAFIGAVYLDQGYDSADEFIDKHINQKIEEVIKSATHIDSKSKFQEIAQEKVGITPLYKTLEAVGPDHDKVFTVGLYLDDELVSKGKGRSKQEAEQEAAENAFGEKGW